MRKIVSVILASLVACVAMAQEQAVDPRAKNLLSKSINSFFECKKGVTADFVIKIEDTRNDKEDSFLGSAKLKGPKFKMSLKDVETYFDGKTQYVWMKNEKEVTISNPDEEDLKDINPILLMKSCNTDYKMRYLGTVTVSGKVMEKIELYPNDLKSKYSILTLLITKENLLLDTIVLKAKNGINTQFHVTKIDTKSVVNDADFVFDTKSHSDVEVVDLR